jgi:long-chain acyl-CoA synthetase
MTILTDHVRFNRIFFRGQVFTSEYLGRAVDECASYLDRNITSNSPVVYLVAPNHVKTIIAFLGIAKSGRAALLVNPKTGKLEYEEMLADTTPSAIVKIDSQTMEFDYAKEVAITDYTMESSLVSQLNDVALLLYTAAEDGYAKAAMLTHRNIISNAQAITEGNHVDSESTTCALLPFHHLFGFQNGAISPMVAHSSFLICDVAAMQKINHIAQNLCGHTVTHIYSVPFIYYMLSKSSLIGSIGRQAYSLISGGYKLPPSLRLRFEQKLGIPIYEGYGLTEASPVCTWNFKDEECELDSIGHPIKYCQVKIFDEINGEAPNNQKGEICIQGDNVMKGYFKHPEATKKAIINGWLRTGDYGKIDSEGNVFFLGLKKKMFNVSGNKVYPEEVKRLMMKNKNVEAVELHAEYQPLTGDSIKATISFVENGPNALPEFRAWCAKNITDYKIPGSMSVSEPKRFHTSPEATCVCS